MTNCWLSRNLQSVVTPSDGLWLQMFSNQSEGWCVCLFGLLGREPFGSWGSSHLLWFLLSSLVKNTQFILGILQSLILPEWNDLFSSPSSLFPPASRQFLFVYAILSFPSVLTHSALTSPANDPGSGLYLDLCSTLLVSDAVLDAWLFLLYIIYPWSLFNSRWIGI